MDRQYPREWRSTLSAEAARWVQEGHISEEQRKMILALYPAATGEEKDRTVLILSVLGSLLLGAGVILFFASNWPVIPAAVKVGTIMSAVIGTYWGGYHLQYVRGDYPRLGQGLLLLGTLFYGAAIWLIAQIFHLESRYPNGFLMWATGILPIAWVTASRPVLYLSTFLLGIWTIMEQTEYASWNVLYPLLLLVAIVPQARKLRAPLAEAGALVGLYLWFALNLVNTDPVGLGQAKFWAVARAMIPYGAAVMTLGLSRLGEERVYLPVGATFALLGTYLLSFAGESTDIMLVGSPYRSLGIGLMLVVVTLAGGRYWQQNGQKDPTVLGGLLLLLIADGMVGLMDEIPRTILFNLLLFGATVGLVLLGIQRRREMLINLGLGAFLLHVLTRYVDLFFEDMDKSLFFVLGGILLLFGGWLIERNRRRWIRTWEE